MTTRSGRSTPRARRLRQGTQRDGGRVEGNASMPGYSSLCTPSVAIECSRFVKAGGETPERHIHPNRCRHALPLHCQPARHIAPRTQHGRTKHAGLASSDLRPIQEASHKGGRAWVMCPGGAHLVASRSARMWWSSLCRCTSPSLRVTPISRQKLLMACRGRGGWGGGGAGQAKAGHAKEESRLMQAVAAHRGSSTVASSLARPSPVA